MGIELYWVGVRFSLLPHSSFQVPLYVHDDNDPSPWPVRGAGLWWRHAPWALTRQLRGVTLDHLSTNPLKISTLNYLCLPLCSVDFRSSDVRPSVVPCRGVAEVFRQISAEIGEPNRVQERQPFRAGAEDLGRHVGVSQCAELDAEQVFRHRVFIFSPKEPTES